MPNGFQDEFCVSRETMKQFEEYAALLRQWNAKINLISRSTEDEIWTRHIRDSAQIWQYRPKSFKNWLDLGSGAGFPGLVVAMLAQDAGISSSFALVESDGRKCAFLRTAIQRLNLTVTLHESRVDAVKSQKADVVSARALASLDVLLGFSEKHRDPEGICLFPKGRTVHNEVEAARVHWDFSANIHPSLTDLSGCIVEIGAFSRV